MEQIKITEDMFNRVNNDINGNPRYAIHFLNFIPSDYDRKTGIIGLYDFVLSLNKKLSLGGRKYHNKSYGGGLVFQSYSLTHTIKYLEEKLNAYFSSINK
jgi:hypothetical protein